MNHPQTTPGSLDFRLGDGGIIITHADPVICVSREWLEHTIGASKNIHITPIYGTSEYNPNKPHITRVSITADNMLVIYNITSYDTLTRTFILSWPD